MLASYLIVAAAGLLIALVGLPLLLQKVGPNWLYGFRTPRTISNEALWYASNKVAGRDFILAGLAQFAISMLALGLALPEAFVGLAVVPVLIAVLHSLWVTSEVAYSLDSGEEVAASASAEALAEGRAIEAARRSKAAHTAA